MDATLPNEMSALRELVSTLQGALAGGEFNKPSPVGR